MPTVASVEVVTPSEVDEPLTLDQAKRHLRIASVVTDDDAYITELIQSARETFEADTGGFTCGETEFRESFDSWPVAEFKLNRRPLLAVESIKYTDVDGNEQTLSTSVYTVDGNRTFPTIWLAYNQSWPTVRGDRNSIRITYTAGHEAVADIPNDVKQAIYLKVGEWFENRQGTREKAVGFDAYQAIVNKYTRSDYP